MTINYSSYRAPAFALVTNIFNIQYTTVSRTYSEGDMRTDWTGNGTTAILMVPYSTGKRVIEFEVVATGGTLQLGTTAISPLRAAASTFGAAATDYAYRSSGLVTNNNVNTSYGAAWGVGDFIGAAMDFDAGNLSFFVNGADQGIAFSGLSGGFIPAQGTISTTGAVRVSTALAFAYPGFVQWR